MRFTLTILCTLPLVFACKSGRVAPEPENRGSSGTAVAQAAEKPKAGGGAEKPAAPTPPPPPPAAAPAPTTRVAPGDPAGGKFTIDEATAGLPKEGKLIAELDTDKG